jgi:hypothetical protein
VVLVWDSFAAKPCVVERVLSIFVNDAHHAASANRLTVILIADGEPWHGHLPR